MLVAVGFGAIVGAVEGIKDSPWSEDGFGEGNPLEGDGVGLGAALSDGEGL